MDGNKFQWEPFYEEFAGDEYLKGPEREQQVSAGDYTIRVSNINNQGKYSLAIGKIESFPADEILKTFVALPHLKTQFFNKPRWTVSEGVIGNSITRAIGLFFALIVLLFLLFRFKR